ncbi:IS30 family transposase [Microbulbifer sp. TRSA005]
MRGYRLGQVHKFAELRRQQAYKAQKVIDSVWQQIDTLTRKELSPKQTVSYLKRHKAVSLHHETICKLIYLDQENGGDLFKHLRIKSKLYRKRNGKYDRRGNIKNRVSIYDRPAVVDRINRIGDWEGDTAIGKERGGSLLTLVERKIFFTVIFRLTGKRSDLLAETAFSHMVSFRGKIKTITIRKWS